MARNAVKMSEEDFDSLVIKWAKDLCGNVFASDDKETQCQTKFGHHYVVDRYVNAALLECVALENKIAQDLSKVNFDWENCGCELDKNDPCGFWTTESGIPCWVVMQVVIGKTLCFL